MFALLHGGAPPHCRKPGAHPSPRPRSTGYPRRSRIQSNAPSLFSGKPDVIVARRMSHLWDAVRPQQTWRTRQRDPNHWLTCAIPEDGGATRTGTYNKIRGERVVARGRAMLDETVPLARGSHRDVEQKTRAPGESERMASCIKLVQWRLISHSFVALSSTWRPAHHASSARHSQAAQI
jgi:Malate synthase G, alpha-beta insertion domain